METPVDAPMATTLYVGELALRVLVADTHEQWVRGLTGYSLSEFGAVGMLFRFGRDVHFAFHAGGVDEPLLIAAFDAAGQVVDVGVVSPGSGPTRPRTAYRDVLELPLPFGIELVKQGLMDGLRYA